MQKLPREQMLEFVKGLTAMPLSIETQKEEQHFKNIDRSDWIKDGADKIRWSVKLKNMIWYYWLKFTWKRTSISGQYYLWS